MKSLLATTPHKEDHDPIAGEDEKQLSIHQVDGYEILRIQIELTHSTKAAGSASPSQKKSVMTFVDLPGREKLDASQNQKDRLADSWEINKGLLGLQKVVDALLKMKTTNSNQSQYEQVPY